MCLPNWKERLHNEFEAVHKQKDVENVSHTCSQVTSLSDKKSRKACICPRVRAGGMLGEANELVQQGPTSW